MICYYKIVQVFTISNGWRLHKAEMLCYYIAMMETFEESQKLIPYNTALNT